MIRRLIWANNIFNKCFILTDSSKLYASRYCTNESNVPEMKYLNVAEKNDAAKNIAAHLSRGTARRREGYSPYNKIYEFDGNIFGQTCKMVMTSVSGHLLTFEFVGSYRGWQTCSPLSLFEAPVMKSCPENYHKIKQTLEREIKGCQGLIIWTDCDREGENIGYEIIQVCTEIKSNLKILRAKFSEITATSVNRALQTLGDPNKNVSDAVDVRQELDLRIGAAFTRFQTLRLQKVFPGQLSNNLVSYGSCQFPTLGFVVERYRAVEKFVPESFWKIKVSHTINDLTVDFAWKRNRLFDEPACLVIHDICSENPNATVQSIKSKPKSKWRPLPLDTVEMEKLGSRKLRINAKEVMKIAEKLYTQGIISYPRTETNIYPKELDLGSLVTVQTVDPDWGPFARGIMESGGPTPRQGKKSDQAHPPIHPTKHVTSNIANLWHSSCSGLMKSADDVIRWLNFSDLSGNEKKVYDLIVRSFLACCSKDAQGHETIVDVDIAGEKFTANGLMIIARNYLDVYPYDKWSGKEIHVYEEGQVFLPTQMDVVGGETSAPSLLTEADLIALMEKHGIGTDATHADHIETIKSRSYVALADNIHFVPGMLGMGLVEGYDSMGLSFSKPLLRAGLEADLKEVCEGRKNSRAVLAEQIAKYRDVYLTVSQEAQKIDQALSIRFNQQPQAPANNDPVNPESHKRVMKCPKCSSDMTLRTKKDGQGFYIGCMSFPQCKNVIWLPSIVNRIVITDSTCETCGPSYSKLEMHWNGRSLEHLYPSPYTCCIGGCDTGILQVLNVNIAVVRPNNISMDSGLGTSTRTLTQSSSSNNTASQRRPQPVQPNRPQNVNNSSNMTNWLRNDNDIPSNNAQTARPQNTSTWNNNSNDSGFTSNSWGNNSRGGSTDMSSDSRTNNRGSSNARGGQSNNSSRGGRAGNQNQPWGQGNNSSSRNPPANNNDDENHILCQCGNEALLLTVRKASANQGRQFYKCAKPQNTGECDFFLWAAENGENNTNTTESRPSGNSNTNSNWGDGSSTNNTNSWGNNNTGNSNNPSSSWGNPGASRGSGSNTYDDSDGHKCNCDLPCKIATVFREGPNKGKRFYGCPNPADRRCNFFEWVDDDSSSSGPSAPSRGRGRGRGSRGRGSNPSARGSNSNSTRGTGERGRKKCGLCREEGHTRNRCPQNDQN